MSAGARVTRLSTTPVKGLALHHPDAIVLLRTGATGDREFFVIDGRDRLISIWKTGCPFRPVHDPERADAFSYRRRCATAQPGTPVIADFTAAQGGGCW